MEQMTLYETNKTSEIRQRKKQKTYEAFVEKFKPKKTTDDCYTPPEVYEVIKDWACKEYGIEEGSIVRPFFPGGDYEHYQYPEDCVVLDNPPFSILTKICEFYLGKGIDFFLFAPSLTIFSGKDTVMKMNHIICDCDIVYENGAVVRTSFVTSYGGDVVAQTCPELTKLVNDVVKRLRKQKSSPLPKYKYPHHIVTAAMLQKYSGCGIDFKIRRGECAAISALDAQKKCKKSIFGGGLLVSNQLAAERAAAERAAAEQEAVAVWKLSQREKDIVDKLGGSK